MRDKRKLYIICAIVLAILLIGIVGTYAWYVWSTDEETETKIVTNLGAATVFYNAGSNITDASLKPTATKEEGIVKTITVSADRTTTYKISFNLYLDVISLDDGLKDTSFKYELYKEGTDTPIKEGNFSQEYLDENLVTCETNSTNHIVLISDETITTTQLKYTLYIWIDGNMENSNDMQSKNFSFKLHADGQNAVLGETLIQEITGLYDGAAKTEVTNNSITYNYATSVSLMNDRLGNANVGADAGNIRYYGADPNNYIDIGDVYTEDTVVSNFDKFSLFFAAMFSVTSADACYDYFDCSTNYEALEFSDEASCNTGLPDMLQQLFSTSTVDGVCGTETKTAGSAKLYRVIGLFKDIEKSDGTTEDLIKIIRDDSIGNFAWDLTYDETSGDVAYGNEWTTATLKTILNDNYYNSTAVTHSLLDYPALVNSGFSTITYYNTTTDLSGVGLSSSVQSKIADVKWNLGGWNTASIYSDQIYGYERGTTVYTGRKTEWNGKVALMYPSDYGYATDFNKCSSNLNSYSTAGCYDNDWLYKAYASVEWMLTPFSGYSDGAWVVGIEGFVGGNEHVDYGIGVRPVFYLDSGLAIVSGDGSESSPYVVR